MIKNLYNNTNETTNKAPKNELLEITSNYDTLLVELEGAISTLYCVWSVLTEEESNTPKTRKHLEDATYSNIEHLERIYKDLQGINSQLWAFKG